MTFVRITEKERTLRLLTEWLSLSVCILIHVRSCNMILDTFERLNRSCKNLFKLFLYVTDVLLFGRIKGKVADRCNKRINTECDVSEKEICPGSGLKACRLERGMVDNNATNPSKEEGQQEANEVVVIHFKILLSYMLNIF